MGVLCSKGQRVLVTAVLLSLMQYTEGAQCMLIAKRREACRGGIFCFWKARTSWSWSPSCSLVLSEGSDIH